MAKKYIIENRNHKHRRPQKPTAAKLFTQPPVVACGDTEKVHFEPKIFRKELRKALRQFSKEESKHLLTWCREKFKKSKFEKNSGFAV